MSRPGHPFADEPAGRNGNRSTVAGRNGMVCASQPLAAMAGIDLLKAGGSAVDAAIAANAMLGLTEPHMNGIGGDLFAIVWSERDRRLFGLNASGRAPADLDLTLTAKRGLDQMPFHGPLSWTVPGCVSGWAALSQRFGRLPLSRCLEPAIDYAEQGFPLSPIIARAFDWPPGLETAGSNLSTVYRPQGRVPRWGDVLKNPDLARSYRDIAEGGPAAFYEGEIAERIAAKSAELGGCMTRRDLAEHEANWVEPVSTSYRGYDVWELPPNGQGIAVLQILNLLEHFDLAAFEPGSAHAVHLLAEAVKLVYADRAHYYADPAFADVPIDWLISREYAAARVASIDPRRASDRPVAGSRAVGTDTVYLTAADKDGNMVSLIQSIFAAWGSGICPDRCGFAMQNRGAGFSLDPEHANRLEPRKRPFHTIIPAFVTRAGAPRLAFGVMGGSFQPQGQVQVLSHMIDHGLSPQRAGDRPRAAVLGTAEPWDARADTATLALEPGFDAAVGNELAAMGHRVAAATAPHGGYQAIWRSDDPLVYLGGSDPRKDGCALCY